VTYLHRVRVLRALVVMMPLQMMMTTEQAASRQKSLSISRFASVIFSVDFADFLRYT